MTYKTANSRYPAGKKSPDIRPKLADLGLTIGKAIKACTGQFGKLQGQYIDLWQATT
jgi:hypothetical protein